MARAEPAERSTSPERAWWLRTLLILQSPRAVFAALRDDSDEAAAARQEPLAAIVFFAGIAAVLASGAAGKLLDDPEYDALLIVFWAIFAGAIYGIASYWVAGGALYLGARRAGASGSYRQARHLLGFAATPLLLWLAAVWPVRLAVYGSDLFRTGGDDGSGGRAVFDSIGGAFLVWCLALLLIGIRTLYGWTWRRAAAALSVAVLTLVAFGVLWVLVASNNVSSSSGIV